MTLLYCSIHNSHLGPKTVPFACLPRLLLPEDGTDFGARDLELRRSSILVWRVSG